MCLILHILRKPNSLIALLFIQNNSEFKNIAKTRLPDRCKVYLRQCTFSFVQLRKYSPNSRCRPPSCVLALFAMFLAIISPSSSCSYNRIQYNSLLTLPSWGFSVTMRLKKKQNKTKLIKIREVVNNSIKRKECGEQSNINIPI